METTKPAEQSSAIEKLVPGVEHFKKVFAANRESVNRALLVTKKITEIPAEDETADTYANNLLVKCNATLDKVKGDRLSATKILDDAKAWAMGPEKDLIAEMERIKKLRNDRANIIAEDKRRAEAAIEAEKQYKIYEGNIKSEMKASLEYGLAKRISDLEAFIADLFNKVDLKTLTKLEQTLSTTKPGLKEEFYNSVLSVPYDQNVMSDKQFGDLVARAKSFDAWKFENVNSAYQKTANDVLQKWKDKLPQKKKELEKIAQGGEAAEKLKQQAVDRAKSEEAQRKAQEEARSKEIETKKNEESQQSALTAEFDSQIKTQQVAEQLDQDGTRKTKVYRIDPSVEINFVKLSALIGKLALNMLTDEDFKSKGGIFKKDKSGAVKKNDKGEPEYVDGIQFWLDKISALKYTPQIEGLVSSEKISTVAKAK